MLGVMVNAALIVVGSLIGIFFGKLLKDSYKATLMSAIGLATLVIGFSGAIKADNMIITIISLVIGSLIGEFLKLDEILNDLGKSLEKRFSKSNLSLGFVTASMLFCVGAMAIIGSIEAGILKSYETLFTKSLLDGITSIILASTLGFGVLLSSVSVLIYQGLIVAFSLSISHLLSDYIIHQVLVVGSILIIGLGLSMLEIKSLKIVNMLPSIIVVVILSIFF